MLRISKAQRFCAFSPDQCTPVTASEIMNDPKAVELPKHGQKRAAPCPTCGAQLFDTYTLYRGHESDPNPVTRGRWAGGRHGVLGCIKFLASEVAYMRPIVERVRMGRDINT